MNNLQIQQEKEVLISNNCKLSAINAIAQINVEPKVQKIFFTIVKDSELNINVNGELTLIFLHYELSSNSKIWINLNKKNANAKIREVVLQNNNYKFYKEVNIVHKAKSSFSDYKFLGFALDNSSIVISAKSRILADMSLSEAHQILKVFTSGNGYAKAEPALLVDNYDVKASHGNSIGQIDERAIYYLQSKGLDFRTARWILVSALLKNLIAILEEEDQKEIIEIAKTILKVKGDWNE